MKSHSRDTNLTIVFKGQGQKEYIFNDMRVRNIPVAHVWLQDYVHAHVWVASGLCVCTCVGQLQGYMRAHVWDGFRVMCVHMCGMASGLCMCTCVGRLQGYMRAHVWDGFRVMCVGWL